MSTSPQVMNPEPEMMPEPDSGVPTFGEKNRDLPDCLRKAITEAVRTLQQREVYDRRIEVLRDRMMRFYEDGIQHVYPNYGTGMYQIGSPGAFVSIGGQQIQCPDYIGAYNIFYPYGRSLDAVLTQNPPGIDFRPDNPALSEDMEAAETAEGYRHFFDQANDVKIIQQKISRMYRLSGRTVIWTRTVANAQKWGLNDNDEPRKMETADVYGTLETKVPILSKSQDDCAYAMIFDDPDILICKKDYSWIAKKIEGGQAGVGENEWERFARLGVLQARKGYFLTGNAGAHITTRINVWLRPAVFSGEAYENFYQPTLDEDPEFSPDTSVNADGEPLSIGDKLNELYPDGCHVTFIGENYAESVNESMDDALCIGFPRERDGMSGGALLQDLIVVQDEYNDLKNAERSAYEKGWPSLWVDAEDSEYDAIVSQSAEPFAIRQKKSNGKGQPLEQMFFREPDMQLPASFVQCMQELRGPLGQFLTGALPALMGDTDKDDKTASGKAMDRAQAMGMLGMPWANMQRQFARMYYQAALLGAKNPDHSKDIVVSNSQGGTTSLRLEKLTKGKFHCHPDTDSSFPESTAAKRENLKMIVTMAGSSPLGATFFESPDNWEEMQTLMGFPELVFTPAMAYRKQVRELEILLRESPVPDVEAAKQALMQHAAATILASQSSQPEPPEPDPSQFMKPSVPALADDYHQWESAKCKEFLSSEECWRELAEGNKDGVQNVRLHKAMHDMFLAQQAQQQAQAQVKESLNFKDLPPEGKVQEAAQAGIKLNAPQAPEANEQVQNKAAAPGGPGKPTV